jgi:hypothetical protein
VTIHLQYLGGGWKRSMNDLWKSAPYSQKEMVLRQSFILDSEDDSLMELSTIVISTNRSLHSMKKEIQAVFSHLRLRWWKLGVAVTNNSTMTFLINL